MEASQMEVGRTTAYAVHGNIGRAAIEGAHGVSYAGETPERISPNPLPTDMISIILPPLEVDPDR